MDCMVRLFGPAAEAAQRREISVPLAGDAPTVAELRQELGKVAPALLPFLSGCRFAVAHQFAHETQPLRPHDEIALIGMVSGG